MENTSKILIVIVIILIGTLGLVSGYALNGYLNDNSTVNQTNDTVNDTNNTTTENVQSSDKPAKQGYNPENISCGFCGSYNLNVQYEKSTDNYGKVFYYPYSYTCLDCGHYFNGPIGCV